MTRSCLVAALLVSTLIAVVRAADDPVSTTILSGESRNASQCLGDARKFLADQKWPEAIEQLQLLIDKGEDELIGLDNRRALQARRMAHLVLAGLPVEALNLYRSRVDPQARRWLDQGLERHEERGLRKVVDEAFCSRPAEKALDALGDLAFERGDFDEAQHWWQLLVPPLAAGKPSRELRYPNPQVDPARIHAKQLLARLFRGDGLDADLKTYRDTHGQAEGTLAGKTGRYAEILQALTQQSHDHTLDLPWVSFGGDGTHGLKMPAPDNLTDRLGQLCRKPRFVYSLEERKRREPLPSHIWLRGLGQEPNRPGEKFNRGSGPAAPRSLAFHPVIAGDQVLFCDARFVTACDLSTGDAVEWYDAARDNGGIQPDLQLPAPADLRYTLTVAEDCVFARLGAQEIQRPDLDPLLPGRPHAPRAESLLVCLGLKAGAGGDAGGARGGVPSPRTPPRLRWQVRPGIANDNAVFEGAPVVRDGLVYIAATRFLGDRTVTAIHCYPASVSNTPPFTPPLRWRKDLCESRDAHPDEKRTRHHLLTLAGPYVVYCSHAGAIVALEAATGHRAWAVRYPPRPVVARADEEAPPTDLVPCLYAGGRLYAAPADSDRLLCLDPASGRTLWERSRLAVVHLLGVGHDRLIFTTPHGLRAVRAADGSDESGWVLPDGGKLAGMGRGLLLGDLVLWPTVGGVVMVRQEDGRQPDNPTLLHNLPPGNLAYGQGCLAVADRTVLSVFVPAASSLGGGAKVEERRPQQEEQRPRIEGRRSKNGREAHSSIRVPRRSPPDEPLLPLLRAWSISLPPGEIMLPEPVGEGAAAPEVFFCARQEAAGGQLVCRTTATGEVRWTCPLSFVPHWVGLHGDRVVAAGPRGAAGALLEEGQRLWELLPVQPGQENAGMLAELRAMSGFQLLGGRLYFFQGERRLLALEAESGQELWTRWAPGGSLGQAVREGRFFPGFQVLPDTILMQTATGRRWSLAAATGRIVRDAPADTVAWPELTFDPGIDPAARPYLIREGGRIVRLDAADGSELWSHPLPGPALLSGEPVQLFASAGGLLVLTPTNLGMQLQRLDLTTGKPLWSRPLLFQADRLELAGATVDQTAFYLVRAGRLAAHALEDGRQLWEHVLPGPSGRWSVRVVSGQGKLLRPDVLLVYPAETRALRWRISWLFGSLQWIVGKAPEGQGGQGCPIHCCDPATGQVIQRLNLQAGPPRVQVPQWSPDGGTAGSTLPRLSARLTSHPTRLTVRVLAHGLMVAVGSQVWGYQAARE